MPARARCMPSLRFMLASVGISISILARWFWSYYQSLTHLSNIKYFDYIKTTFWTSCRETIDAEVSFKFYSYPSLFDNVSGIPSDTEFLVHSCQIFKVLFGLIKIEIHKIAVEGLYSCSHNSICTYVCKSTGI